MNRGGAKVAAAAHKAALSCLKRAAKGAEPDAQACLAEDPRGKVARAKAKLSRRACSGPLPDFAYTGALRVADAAVLSAHGFTHELFGEDLGAAVVTRASSRPDAACQARAAKDAGRLLAAYFKQANAATKTALATAEDGAAVSQPVLAALAGERRPKLDKAAAKLRASVTRKCIESDLNDLFPGTCGATGTPDGFVGCVEERARCRFCLGFAHFDALPIDCDAFDDGAANASCLTLPLPFVRYDRTDVNELVPVPDDFWLVDDPTTPSGRRIEIGEPTFPDVLGQVARGLASGLRKRDGFSPLQPIVLEFSEAIDPATAPLTLEASLDPAASVGLFDVDPASPSYGERLPFLATTRSDLAGDGNWDHTMILFPALDFAAGGRYGLVVTRGLATFGGTPFGPSAFFERVLSPAAGEPPQAGRARDAVADVLDFLANDLPAPVRVGDPALALSFSVRGVLFDPSDWVSVKEQTLAAAPPVLAIDSTEARGGDVVHRGTVELPLWIEDGGLTEVTRDGGGSPLSLDTDSVPFVLRIPIGFPGPRPVVLYQHGNPGSPEQVVIGITGFLADAGYAILGIQDVTNRRFGTNNADQLTAYVGRLAFLGELPLVNFQTHADLMAAVRAIQGMGTPGNFPEIDPSRILFGGISGGAIHSLGFLPFAQEVTAAVSHVGSGRLLHVLLHQLDYQNSLGDTLAMLPGARPRDVIAGFALLQILQDRDDPQLLARHLYREPLAIEGLADTTPPSLLWIEGIGDSLVGNTATRAAAVELGIPTLRPVAEPSPVLTEVDGPLRGNIDVGVTAGHFQYDPATTPSCVRSGDVEGHSCAIFADEANAQVLHFFDSALAGDAEIINPLP